MGMKKNSLSKKRIFDYIVIGAGTAGGVIAKKLTDDKKHLYWYWKRGPI
ncbi:hypothetical protein [Brevibacillus centrosporus]|nr:hypothetical protein [Brevibacillus centrosporus]